MSEPLDSLVEGWKRHFAAADQQIEWRSASERIEMELTPGIWLVGETDGRGLTGSDMFFGEWKTANPREEKTWKQVWRMNPQSLSYGVLVRSRYPECERFTVRKAFKKQVPTYDHCWFRYSQAELDFWTRELITMAYEIKHSPLVDNWPTNFSRCFRYGPNYVCPFFECACSKLDFNAIPAGSTMGGDPNWSATQQRAAILARDPNAIVLSPTTAADWLDCREMYRRKYVELVTPPKNESLILGGNFHEELAKHYNNLIRVKEEAADVI